ncbi:tyrosine-type recombinase/integrase [Anabaena cylindrica FACHB-243]|uniref:Integrase family protein n=1 Tax=Anabaena cylindrica (strain ATCC 27899 / PCC 7122) TaxID=272123 RepID=K9ZNP0_ANACC|nr:MULTISPECIES: tyrosine-type recombinase/integrase [Anabaena]AFZ60811.1 integrase family protein [Anabaena cylindrica PCC 7122]MBD2417111.1 tyrosine-type recombinase/integrase [Anabaena cylindrica FACHB-243]MBY5280807.1 tyrosine-type recombinase/integrase [Anabaena sp. CCAP 1446/1C]MBY5307083.1 tyrosine-type recombinase/integrase [Anabaena sp. CCAP 1446/1C]MCM2406812.1 tyrosine-type recombinase/integrase [Anabaena sp. CCAP 1446/1C]
MQGKNNLIDDLLEEVRRANSDLEIVNIGAKRDKSGKYRIRIRARSRDISFEKYTFPLSKQGLKATIKICSDIEYDYFRGCFDPTLVKYGLAKSTDPKLTEVRSLPKTSEPNLLELWESYKALKPDAPNSTKSIWKIIDRWLNECPSDCLVLANADRLLKWLRSKYSDGSLASGFRLLKAAVNLAVKLGKVSGNPYIPIYELLDTKKKKQIKAFSKAEIKIIIQSFKDSRFDSSYSAYPSSYYAPLVEFRFLTGCRPSEVIALTWDDIKDNGSKVQIIFSKRYSYGQILEGTKNGVAARIFPCNKQLSDFIRSLPKISNANNLVFPGFCGGYITSGNFSNIWRKYITKLVNLGLVKDYMPWYDERHTFTTHIARSGHDLKTISSVVGNSTRTLIDNYLATNQDIELPEI